MAASIPWPACRGSGRAGWRPVACPRAPRARVAGQPTRSTSWGCSGMPSTSQRMPAGWRRPRSPGSAGWWPALARVAVSKTLLSASPARSRSSGRSSPVVRTKNAAASSGRPWPAGWHGLGRARRGGSGAARTARQPGRRLCDGGRRNAVAGADVATGPVAARPDMPGAQRCRCGRSTRTAASRSRRCSKGSSTDVGPRCGVDDTAGSALTGPAVAEAAPVGVAAVDGREQLGAVRPPHRACR